MQYFIDLSQRVNSFCGFNFQKCEVTKKKMGQGYFTESSVGFMVYLVSLGFFVDNPSSCNVNPTPIIAAERTSLITPSSNFF